MTHWRRPDEPEPRRGCVAWIITMGIVMALLLISHYGHVR